VPLLLVNVLTSLPLTLSRPRISVTSSSAIVVPGVGFSGGFPGALYVGNRQMFRAVQYKEKTPKQTEVNASKEKSKHR
jgi:hypothetical protein